MANVPMYREYGNDAEKTKVYAHRLVQAERKLEEYAPAARRAWSRYESKKLKSQRTGSGHYVSSSLAPSTIDALYSSMTAVEVDINVTPEGETTEDEAYVAQSALQQEWETCHVQEEANVAIKDALVVGIGWVKVGYEFYEEEQELPRPDEDIRAEVQKLIDEAADARARGELKNIPDAATIAHAVPLTEVAGVTLRDQVVVDYVPWDMVLWDPTANRMRDCRWVAQKTLVPPREVRENPLYQEYVRSRRNGKKLTELKHDTTISKDVIGVNTQPQNEDERITLYTVWDFETGTVCTFAKGQDFLLDEQPNPFAINDHAGDKSPFVPLILRSTGTRLRGISEMEVMDAAISERDLYRSRLATGLERSIPRILAKERTLTPVGKAALTSQEIGAVVEVEDSADLTTDVKDFPTPNFAPQMYDMPNVIEQEVRDSTGVSELMRGLFPDRKRTATETSEVVSASAARQSEKRGQLEAFYRAIARRVLQLMQMYYDAPRVMHLVDDPGQATFEWTASDIARSVGLSISLTPKEARTWQKRRDDAYSILNVLGPFAQTPDPATGAPPVLVTDMLRYLLGELNIPRRIIKTILALPEEQQKSALGSLQNQAAQAQAAQGVTNSTLVPGPLTGPAVAASANPGEIPPEIIAAAQGGISPGSTEAAKTVSSSRGTPAL